MSDAPKRITANQCASKGIPYKQKRYRAAVSIHQNRKRMTRLTDHAGKNSRGNTKELFTVKKS
ncbi:MAG: hypothetical protein AB8A30_00735 [Prochlorococcus sp.]